MRYSSIPFELKELDEPALGTFEGLASVYGNVDLGGDVVEPGAFKEFALTKDGYVRILASHDTRSVIGKGKVIDTHVGLVVKGRLLLDVAKAREQHVLMKEGVVDGLSIGFDILGDAGVGYTIDDSGVRHLLRLKLWEISTTPFPMNQNALVTSVKGALERVRSIRELEDLLRDAVGLSRAQAKLHAGAIWKTLTGRREDEPDGAGVEDAVATVQRLTGFFRSFNSEGEKA